MIFTPLLIFLITLSCCILALELVAWWIVFEKAGEPGWQVLIPIYNIIVFLRIVGKPWWWLFLFMIPLVNIVFIVWAYNMLSKSFGRSEGFTAGLVLVRVVFASILAFGSSRYNGPAGAIPGFTTEYRS